MPILQTEKQGALFELSQLFYALIPICLSVAILSFEFDRDFWIFSITFVYLFILIKYPWDLYYASIPRKLINTVEWASQAIEPSNAPAEALRYQKSQQLSTRTVFSFLLTILGPALGGYSIVYIKPYLINYSKYLTDFNIALFVITCELRPLAHLFKSGVSRSKHIQSEVNYPNSLVEQLQIRVSKLEEEMLQLKKAYATKREVISMKEGLQPAFQYIGRMVQKSERKTDLYMSYEEERFLKLEQKVGELNEFITNFRLSPGQSSSTTSIINTFYYTLIFVSNLTRDFIMFPFYIIYKLIYKCIGLIVQYSLI
jgi:hypothetical protein